MNLAEGSSSNLSRRPGRPCGKQPNARKRQTAAGFALALTPPPRNSRSVTDPSTARAGPIGVFGLSSGAELALLAAFTETGASRPGAVVAWSAPTSFAKLASNPDAGIITQYLGCEYARCPDRWRDASPIAHASGAAPPTLLVSSADDPQVPATQSRSLYRALHSAGATAELDIEPGAAHAQFGPSTVSRCAEFLLRHLS